ncbi:MAG: hypothetical protein MUC48_26790 [Leptolyngbya sp. Prado105]|jgi:hypothetical protein|nr:hypothetical protein [Leptolyngbya sp. Prado105]
MSHSLTLTLDLDDTLKQALDRALEQNQQSAETLILQLLIQNLTPASPMPDAKTDPLLKLIGCINTDISDVAENHDHYIGQALYEEMHPNE